MDGAEHEYRFNDCNDKQAPSEACQIIEITPDSSNGQPGDADNDHDQRCFSNAIMNALDSDIM